MRFLLLFIGTLGCVLSGEAAIRWFNPKQELQQVVGGQAWKNDIRSNIYYRLPDKAQKKVRESVWNLGCQSAGLYLRFYTDSPNIIVRYGVKGAFSMPHMPATGVSGVDLYAIDKHGKELWCGGNYHFADTVTYRYTSLDVESPYGREYQLFLPLYNQVEWLEIGVEEEARFSFVPVTLERPVVIYGTSIAQGACASRPGMAWTNIVLRRLGGELINVGFSGNGKLENSVIDLLAEIDAKAYVFDCMPNLTGMKKEILTDSIVHVVQRIKKIRPEVPLILSEHAGYPNGSSSTRQRELYSVCNEAVREAYERLKAENIEELYLFTNEEMAQPLDATVEGVHPNDYGMNALANAYEKKLREVLHEPVGRFSTQQPVTQRREPNVYEWRERHEQVLALCRERKPKLLLLGNSLTHHWGGEPAFRIARDSAGWNRTVAPLGAINMGFGWDRIENLLWRVYHGELDGYQAEKIVVMIGTNNLNGVPDEEIVEGIRFLLEAIRFRQPQAIIRLVGIPPRRGEEAHLKQINAELKEVAQKTNTEFLDLTSYLTTSDGKMDPQYYIQDGLHLNQAGYQRIGEIFVK